jgi:hypothetical protein
MLLRTNAAADTRASLLRVSLGRGLSPGSTFLLTTMTQLIFLSQVPPLTNHWLAFQQERLQQLFSTEYRGAMRRRMLRHRMGLYQQVCCLVLSPSLCHGTPGR